MATNEFWCSEKLSTLLQENSRICTLSEIKEYLSSIPQDEAKRIVNTLDLLLVFDCLNDSDDNQIELACEVLSMCLNRLSIGESTTKYGVVLERALCHPTSSVKLMALNEISRNIAQENALLDLCSKVSLIKVIITCISDSDLLVVKNASSILCSVGTTIPGIRQLTCHDLLNSLDSIMSISGIMRLRIYEILIDISAASEYSFSELKSTRLLNNLLEELDNNDILLRLNIVQLLTKIGITNHGYLYLEENKIFEKLISLLYNADDLLTVQLCEPGVLKSLGHITNSRPAEFLSRYPTFLDRLFNNLEEYDLTVVSATLIALSFIGKTSEGKVVLYSTVNKITHAIQTIVKLLGSLPTEVKILALNFLEDILTVTENRDDIITITEKWFGLFGNNPMEIVLKYAKNPFQELRLSGLGILLALAKQIWGQKVIRNTPGLIEFLVDRSIETTKECKEMKYEIVRELAKSCVFEPTVLKILQTFVNEGPFYVHSETEVAIDGRE